MLISTFKATDDLGFPIVAPAAEDLIKHFFNQGGNLRSSSEEIDMVPKPRTLGKKKATGVELDQQTPDLILAIPSPAEVQLNIPTC